MMDRRRGGGGGDRYRSRSPDPYHHFNSSKYSRTGGSGSRLMSPDSADTRRQYHQSERRGSFSYQNPTPPPARTNTNNPNNTYRSGDRGDHQDRGRDYRRPSFDSPPPCQLSPVPRFPPSPAGDGVGWVRPMSNFDRDRGGGFHAMSPLSGQKRGYSSFSDDIRAPAPPPPERSDGTNFAKLFIGSVPRTATEEDIRPVFDQHGRVLEVALIRDKTTGQQQGCCFIKYGSSQEADRAIRMLHNQYTLPGGVGPIQVRYADGERERLGTAEFKLFVGSLNKHATEKEVEEIFVPYGRVEDVYLMRDEMKQSRGCGFVKYAYREMALAAINALNGRYTMRGCDHPLTVRFADPKRPRLGESRGGAPFGGPGLSPRLPPPEIRPPMMHGEPMQDRFPANALQPMSPQKPGPRPPHGFGNHFQPRPADMPVVSKPGDIDGSSVRSTSFSLSEYAVSSASTIPLNYGQSLPPVSQQQISPCQKSLQSPTQLPSSLLLQPPNVPSFFQGSVSHPSGPLPGPGGSQVQIPGSAGQTLNQAFQPQQLIGSGGQLSVSQLQAQPNALSALGQGSSMSNLHQQQLPAQQQSLQQPLQQSPSQLAQLLSQQTQTLQASFQSSQQAFSQLQQQLQLMQPSNQGSLLQQGVQPSKQQVPWAGTAQNVGDASGAQPRANQSAALSANPATPTSISGGGVALGKSNWTEHTSPDGYKYYYNSTTGESKWEKPEEVAIYEQQQQQKPPFVQYPQGQHSQGLSVHGGPQKPTPVQNYNQTQLPEELAKYEQLQQQKPPFVQYPQGHSLGQPVHSVPHKPTPVQNYAQTQLSEEVAKYEQQQQQNPPYVQYPQGQHSQSRFVHGVPRKPTPVQNYTQTQLPPQNQTQLQTQNHPTSLQQSSQSLPGTGVIGHHTIQELRYTQLPAGAGSKSMNDPGRLQQPPAQDWMWEKKPAGI